MEKIVIITGASSGLGEIFVKELIELKGKKIVFDTIWLVARRKDRLNQLMIKYPNQDFKTIVCDLESTEEIRSKIQLNNEQTVVLLVNNAGFGKFGPFDDGQLESQLGQIDLNCKALTQLTFLVLPFMKMGSGIINIASSAAFAPQPQFAVYAATKSYVLSFSRALQVELANRKIQVTAVCPGPVETEFFQVALNGKTLNPLKKLAMAKGSDVVKLALKDYFRKKELSIFGLQMKLFKLFSPWISPRMIGKIMK